MSSNNKRHYLPTLLERLQDDEPKSHYDRARPIDSKQMRRIVQRDITDLINHCNIESEVDELRHPLVIGSVLNYGISALVGTTEHYQGWHAIEQKLRKTILLFEPRIIPETLLIRSRQDNEHVARHAMVQFEISGLIYWHPRPIDLSMSCRYDFESGKVDLKLV